MVCSDFQTQMCLRLSSGACSTYLCVSLSMPWLEAHKAAFSADRLDNLEKC